MEETTPAKHNLAEVMAMAGQPDAIIYTIGLFDPHDPDRNPRALKQLAKPRAARRSCQGQ